MKHKEMSAEVIAKKVTVTQEMSEALDKSLADWIKLRDGGYDNLYDKPACALCVQDEVDYQNESYNNDTAAVGGDCSFCPIFKMTGNRFCYETPWEIEATDPKEMVKWLENVRANTSVSKGKP